MEYRNFGKLDWKVSALGFGCMRFPTLDGEPTSSIIDEKEAIWMLHQAIDQGVNYLDTAYPYHGGNSEIVVGKALRGSYRDKVRLATKSPTWLIQNEGDFERLLNTQLERLQTDHVDFYLLHALNQNLWQETVLRHKILEHARAAQQEGRIHHLGFSFHDKFDCFCQIINGYDNWALCQIQYNFLDPETQAGSAGLKMAAEKGLAVVVMEPLFGGRLALPPADIQELIEKAQPRRSPADLALQWIWDQPEVSAVLSGMSSREQLESNLESAGRSRIHSLDSSDQELIGKIRSEYQRLTLISCTRCGYCMPCPNGVDIPENFKIFNDAHLHRDVAGARFWYQVALNPQSRADACAVCHECEEKCPQAIPISDWMPKIHEVLGSASAAG